MKWYIETIFRRRFSIECYWYSPSWEKRMEEKIVIVKEEIEIQNTYLIILNFSIPAESVIWI